MSTPTTPPHHPTYAVNLSERTIRDIAALVSPERRLNSIQQLESGKSFNNRIYFLDYDDISSDRIQDTHVETGNVNHVLKVSGRFWGLEKVQNEVSCLLLLERFCADVPAPRVVAYSEDGRRVCLVSRCRSHQELNMIRDSATSAVTDDQRHPWILLTRLPGAPLEVADLHGSSGENILKQLARYVAMWREKIPRNYHIGNVQILDPTTARKDELIETFPGMPSFRISGLLNCTRKPPNTISTPLEYYTIQLNDQLDKLEANNNFAANREELVPLLRTFIASTLPNLHMFHGRRKPAVFTHNDLSPRNILVSETGTITGVLDFEFAGFFPEEEDFANNMVHGRDDWPECTDAILFAELEKLGVDTPLQGFDKRAWDEAKVLFEVIANIAPWHLEQGDVQVEESGTELREAAEVVRNGVQFLQCGTS